MVKKVVRKSNKTEASSQADLQDLCLADLYALYLFVSNDANNRGFGMTSPEARKVVRNKQKEIEKELYVRAYGLDPFAEYKLEIEGMKPEDIDLDRVAIVQGDNKEPEDEKPETFIVVKNKEKEE